MVLIGVANEQENQIWILELIYDATITIFVITEIIYGYEQLDNRI